MSEPSPKLLVVEADQVLGPMFQQVLAEMGYASTLGSSLKDALGLIHQQPLDLILTDTFSSSGGEALASLCPLLALSYGVPVILCTAWSLTESEVKQEGFAGFVPQPFNLDQLVTAVAECLNLPWSPDQLRQAEVAKRYVAAYIQWDVEALVAMYTEDVRLFPWIVPAYPRARPVSGRAAAQAYHEEEKQYFSATQQIELINLYPCPRGIAARLLLQWQDPPGVWQQQIVAGCLKVTADDHVSQVGLPPPDEHVLAQFSPLRGP
jgi:CheY-like chemotaxis protein